jgi:hypothetical protein
MRKTVLLLLLIMTCFSDANADFDLCPGLIGILSLPEIFGEYECDTKKSGEEWLYSDAACTKKIGKIKVTRDYILGENGGCSDLEVQVHLDSQKEVSMSLPWQQYDYDERGVMVIDKKAKAFKIPLEKGSAWVCPGDKSKFYSLLDLYRLNYNVHLQFWDGYFHDKPGGKKKRLNILISEDSAPEVEIIETKVFKGKLWFKVKIPAEDPCGEIDKSIKPATGWVPAHNKDGFPTLWFYSKGC